MKIVLPFLIFLIFALLLLFSSIKLDVKRCNISNIKNGIKRKKFDKNLKIYIGIYLFGKIKILNLQLTEKLINKMGLRKVVKTNTKVDTSEIKDTFSLIKNFEIKIEKFKLNLEISGNDVNITTYLVVFISSMISIALKNNNYQDVYFRIRPNFKNENVIRLNLSCIISVKIIHIICALVKHKLKQANVDNRYLKFI